MKGIGIKDYRRNKRNTSNERSRNKRNTSNERNRNKRL